MIETLLSSNVLHTIPKWKGKAEEVEEVEEVTEIDTYLNPSVDLTQQAVVYTLNDLLLERARTIPDEPFVGYPSSPWSAGDYVYYTPKDLSRFADGSARCLVEQGLPNYNLSGKTDNKIIALLGPSNLDYVSAVFAISRLGYGALLLSTRLATEAYVSLLDKTGCQDILGTASTAKTIAAIQAVRALNKYSIPEQSEYDTALPSDPVESPSSPESLSRIAIIIHSSGSTGLPKPIFQTQKACLSNYASGTGYRAFLTLPLYHNHGLSTFFRALYKGKPISMYNASLPLSNTNLVKAMEASKPESFHGVPYALKLLSESQHGIELLRNCKLVLFGGSSCPDDLGDKLVENGVYVVSHYGATEMGQLMTSHRPPGDKAWNYVRPLPSIAPFLSMVPQGDGSFECVCLDGLPAKVATNSDDPPNSFKTSDTFLPHPTIPHAWKYLGRTDDRVTLVNGEKVLPIPMEHQVRQNEYVKEALIFGVGQALPGLIVIPSEKTIGLSKDEVMEKVWPSVEVANSRAEGFSQIDKEMIAILEPNTEYPLTDKGTIIRLASYRRFQDVIDAVYERFDSGNAPGQDDSTKLSLDLEGLTSFLLKFFTTELDLTGLEADTDLFNAGVDSLQGLKARSYFKRELNLGGQDLDHNVVFEYPSVAKLASHLNSLRTGEIAVQENEITAMEELISKYSSFQKHSPQPAQETVLITGATGSLGAHILHQLLKNSNVKRVYCLVRASSSSAALDRVLTTLSAKKLLPFGNTHKIIALPSSLGEENLGLPASILEDLKNNLTKVIHSAWAVNFNLQIRSFESQHIAGVSNLINLCLSVRTTKPAQFFFCSSISAAAGTPIPATISEAPVPKLEHAQGMGYAQSKLVAERIVQAAAERTGMVAKVLRVGQIVGDSEAGIWNTTEAIPLMIQSAVTLGALPALDETPSWLPVDVVARTILDLTHLSSSSSSSFSSSALSTSASTPTSSSSRSPASPLYDSTLIYQIQNPHTFHWTHDLLPALSASGLTFNTVSAREWVRLLRESSDDAVRNPTKKLLDFFEAKYDHDGPSRRGLVFETRRTEEDSETLRGGWDVVGSGLVGRMVKEWKGAWDVEG